MKTKKMIRVPLIATAIFSAHHAASAKTISSCHHRRQPAFVTLLVGGPRPSRSRSRSSYHYFGNAVTITISGERSRPLTSSSSSSNRQNNAISQLRLRLPLHQLSSTTQPIDQLADDDLVALPFDGYMRSIKSTKDAAAETETSDADALQLRLRLRLCVVRNQEYVFPLIRHEDDVETDLFLDPRCFSEDQIPLADVIDYWSNNIRQKSVNNDDATTTKITTIAELPYYGVGWYGQRPVPSLGGGPGYGAEADEVWSIEEDVLHAMMEEGALEVEIPVIDVGMAHGEKARGGALF